MGFEPSFYLDRTTSHLTIHGTKYKYLPLIPKWRMTSALEDPDTPRVVISRNPFTRILSGYLNKVPLTASCRLGSAQPLP